MLTTIIALYLLLGMLTTFRVAWIGGVQCAIMKAEAKSLGRTLDVSVPMLTCIYIALMWPTYWVSVFAEYIAEREIKNNPLTLPPPAQLQLNRPGGHNGN
jgi:hypothetical protein